MVDDKKKTHYRRIDNTNFKEGNLRTDINLSEIGEKKVQGAHVSTSKYYSDEYLRSHKGVWLPKELDINNWLRKLKIALHKIFNKWYGKKIVTEKEILTQEKKISELQKQLFEEQKKREEMEKDLEDYKSKKELAKEIKTGKQKYQAILNKFESDIKKAVKENNNVEEKVKEEIRANQ